VSAEGTASNVNDVPGRTSIGLNKEFAPREGPMRGMPLGESLLVFARSWAPM
jgi:hypothetical protein